MIDYTPLKHTLIDKNKTKTDLKRDLSLSPATVAKIDKNEYIALQVIDRICEYLECRIEDVVRHVKTENSEV